MSHWTCENMSVLVINSKMALIWIFNCDFNHVAKFNFTGTTHPLTPKKLWKHNYDLFTDIEYSIFQNCFWWNFFIYTYSLYLISFVFCMHVKPSRNCIVLKEFSPLGCTIHTGIFYILTGHEEIWWTKQNQTEV